MKVVPIPDMDHKSLKKIFREEAEMRGMEMIDIPAGVALSEVSFYITTSQCICGKTNMNRKKLSFV